MHGKENQRLESVTDLLITATEQADDIEQVAILALLKDGDFIILTNCSPLTVIGMSEVSKNIMLKQTSEDNDD